MKPIRQRTKAPPRRAVGPGDLLGHRIIAVDSCQVYLHRSRRTENVITSLTLDNGFFVCLDAHETGHVPLVTYDVYRPRRIPRRRCHGCGREIDRYAPTNQVFCGECGKP
jgi:hypothetical protein